MTPAIIEAIGWTATVIAVAGVVANNRRLRICFVLWLASNSMCLLLHAHAGMVALTVRDAAFLCLAVHGLILWGCKPPADTEKTQ